MNSQIERAEIFRSLHIPGDPIVLYNIWDAGSAVAVARGGAKAIATGSWSVAAAQGYSERNVWICLSPWILKAVTQMIPPLSGKM